MAFVPDGRTYVANFDGHSVSVIGSGGQSVVATIAQPDGQPAAVALRPAGDRAYVTNFVVDEIGEAIDGFVSVIETTGNSVVTTVAVGKFPVAIAVAGERCPCRG